MAYSEEHAQILRDALSDVSGITEKKMFGGLCFLLGGNMAAGIVGDDLMLRVGPDAHSDAISRPYGREMDSPAGR